MAAREYIGAGGMRLHLDEPLNPQMAAQFAKGELRLAEDGEPLLDADRNVQPQVIQHGADAPKATRVGRSVPEPPERPGPDDHPGAWATYAVRRGLLATKATSMSRQQLIEWVEADEAAEGVGDAGEGFRGPEHASVVGRPHDGTDDEGDGEPKSAPKKPAANAKVADWRDYAVALGMEPDVAKDATKQDCQDYAQVVEDARDSEQPEEQE